MFNPFPKDILNSSKLKEFADENFRFDENGRKFFKHVKNTMGKRDIARLRAISSFPTVFSKDQCERHIKTIACLGKGQPFLSHMWNIALHIDWFAQYYSNLGAYTMYKHLE